MQLSVLASTFDSLQRILQKGLKAAFPLKRLRKLTLHDISALIIYNLTVVPKFIDLAIQTISLQQRPKVRCIMKCYQSYLFHTLKLLAEEHCQCSHGHDLDVKLP